jgi:uncharacterized integral membrane protein
MNDNAKKLRIMATWTVAVFAVIFAIVLVVLWIINYPVSHSAFTALGEAFKSGWPMLLIDLVLCAGLYIGYSLYIKNKK